MAAQQGSCLNMSTAKEWNVQIIIDEHDDDSTHAQARLVIDGDTKLVGDGHARRNPHDREVPQIGDEVAAARALSELAGKLLGTAATDIADATGESATLTS
jgi:hypothetical protein